MDSTAMEKREHVPTEATHSFIKEQLCAYFRYGDRVVSKRDQVLALMECSFTFGEYIQDLTPTTFLTNQAIALVQSVSPK